MRLSAPIVTLSPIANDVVSVGLQIATDFTLIILVFVWLISSFFSTTKSFFSLFCIAFVEAFQPDLAHISRAVLFSCGPASFTPEQFHFFFFKCIHIFILASLASSVKVLNDFYFHAWVFFVHASRVCVAGADIIVVVVWDASVLHHCVAKKLFHD